MFTSLKIIIIRLRIRGYTVVFARILAYNCIFSEYAYAKKMLKRICAMYPCIPPLTPYEYYYNFESFISKTLP